MIDIPKKKKSILIPALLGIGAGGILIYYLSKPVSASGPHITITDYGISPSSIKSGQGFNLSISISNDGDAPSVLERGTLTLNGKVLFIFPTTKDYNLNLGNSVVGAGEHTTINIPIADTQELLPAFYNTNVSIFGSKGETASIGLQSVQLEVYVIFP